MLWLHKSKDVLVSPPVQSILPSQWLTPPPNPKSTLGSSDAAKVGRGESGGHLLSPPPPIPRVVVCAAVSSLDQVFMTPGQFSADSQEPPPRQRATDESFMIGAAEAELDAAHVRLIASLLSF